MKKNFKQLLKNITTFIFDVDGVLTDGSVILLPTGEQIVKTNIKDGYALQLAIKKGYKVCIISGKKSEALKIRLKELGINDVYLGITEKMDSFEDYLFSNHLKAEEIMYMGDDMPDYEVMQKAGIAACPEDAAEEIKAISIYISNKKGGHGCARDVIEQVMKVQEKWPVTRM